MSRKSGNPFCEKDMLKQQIERDDDSKKSFAVSKATITMNDQPASGRRRPPKTPKGRQVDPRALAEVQALLGDRSRQRDLLIEHLHLIQDRYGYLSAAHLAALAEEMKLALAEVYEVATFYAHFDVVKEGAAAATGHGARVRNLSCAMAGAEKLLHDLPGKLGTGVRVLRAPCMGACDRAPVCAVGHVQVIARDTGQGRERRSKPTRTRTPRPTPKDFAAYRARRRLPVVAGVSRRAPHARRHHQDRERCRAARAGRRGISDRPQMVAGARRASAAADGRQRR